MKWTIVWIGEIEQTGALSRKGNRHSLVSWIQKIIQTRQLKYIAIEKTLHRMFQWYLLLTAKCHPHYKRQSIWGSRITTRICSKIESRKLQNCKITPKQSSYSAFYLNVSHHRPSPSPWCKNEKMSASLRLLEAGSGILGCINLSTQQLTDAIVCCKASKYTVSVPKSWIRNLGIHPSYFLILSTRNAPRDPGGPRGGNWNGRWYGVHRWPLCGTMAESVWFGTATIGDHWHWSAAPLLCSNVDTLTPPSGCRVNMRILVHHGHSSSTSQIREN